MSHPGGLGVILKHATSCQKAAAAAAREAFNVAHSFTLIVCSNAVCSSFREKTFALKLDQSIMFVQELNKNKAGKSCNNS